MCVCVCVCVSVLNESAVSLSPGPSVAVTNVSVVLVDNENKVNITWKPLEAGHWNGIPFGYYVSSHTHVYTTLASGLQPTLANST